MASKTCRICTEPREDRSVHDGLCKVCGQKREVYVAAIISSRLMTLPVCDDINLVFSTAEQFVSRDRNMIVPKDISGIK